MADSSVQGYPCMRFKIDMKKGFGQCACGFGKPDHSQERRKQLKKEFESQKRTTQMNRVETDPQGVPIPVPKPPPIEKNTHKQELNDEEEHVDEGKDLEPCENYRFDHTKPYNTCSCGWTKVDHEQAAARRANATAAAQQKEIEQAGQKTQREIAIERGVPCDIFEVDLTSAGGYGVCLCGLTRQDHQDFKSSPQAWIDTKASLTEPKPFE